MNERGGRCPGADTLSAYLDREMESPWRELIERHIESCPDCRQAVQKLLRLRQLLHADREPDYRSSIERLRERLRIFSPDRRPGSEPFWKRKVAMPLPAAAAAVFLILCLGFLLAFVTGRADLRKMSIKRGPAGTTEVQVAAPIEDLQLLLKSLDKQSQAQAIIITLPENSQFIMLGTPRIMRETEFTRVRR